MTEIPSRFSATPAQIDKYLRTILCDDTYLAYQRAVGNKAVEEAAEDVRRDTALRQTEGQSDLAGYGRELADLIDPVKDGGHYPSRLLCSRHGGFDPCPGRWACIPPMDGDES